MYKFVNYLWPDKDKHLNDFSVSVAESVTAGGVSNSLCSEPGASEFFKGGIVAYNIQSKKDILNIDIEYAELNNFANPFTTSEMAKSVSKMFNSRIGIATTGYSLPIHRAEDKDKKLCALDIKNPYAYICLYDRLLDREIIHKIEFDYTKDKSDVLQRAMVQTKVSLEAKKIYLTYKRKNNHGKQ